MSNSQKYKDLYNKMYLSEKEVENMKKEILHTNHGTGVDRRGLRFARKRVAVGIAACVLSLSTIAVVAAESAGVLDKVLMKFFGADSKLQETLEKDGYIDTLDGKTDAKEVLSQTQDGVTVSVNQTIIDNYGFYIYLDVNTDGKELTGEKNFGNIEVLINGEDASVKAMGFVPDEYTKSDGKYGYLIQGTSVEGGIVGKEINVKFKNLHGLFGVVEGEWNFHWTAKGKSNMKTINLDHSWKGEYEENGRTYSATVNFKSFEMSPVSYCLKYECDDDEFNEFDWVEHEIPIKIYMKDGTCYAKPIDEEGQMYLWGTGSACSEWEISSLTFMIDVNEIDYVEIGGEKYTMK